MAPLVLVVLSYYSTIFMFHRYDTGWFLGSVIIIVLSFSFLASLLMAAYGRFIPK